MSKFKSLTLVIAGFAFIGLNAQSLNDGVYMPKKNICGGFMYMHDSWDKYWEGTFKRTNENIGTITTEGIAFGATYGITDKLNVSAMLPYIWTQASEGTLTGLKGFQDLTAGLKYNAFTTKFLKGIFDINAIAGFSLPVSNYVADLQPVSIGLHSNTAFGRAMIRYAHSSNLSFTAYATYSLRQNVTIDRNTYYTDHLIYSNEVAMPDVFNFNLKLGYFSYRWAAEVFYDNTDCQGGFDIRRNDMPFISNEMDMTRVGFMGHYRIKALSDIQIVGSIANTISGRNVGESTTFTLGLFKILDFNNKTKN